MDLVCIGDVMIDVAAVSGSLARGGDVHGRVHVRPGGTSANAAVWGTWAGAATAVVAAVGDDVAGELAVRELQRRSVDTAWVRHRRAPTGVMLVMSESGERSMVADRGANALLNDQDLPALEAGAVLVSGYLLLQEPGREVALAAIDRARTPLLAIEAASWPLVERFGAGRFLDATQRCTVVLANDEEAEALVGRRGSDAARALGERFRVAAVKRGPAGAVVCMDGELIEAPGETIDEVDPTGAGDAFDGALLASLVLGVDPAQALVRACHAGALAASSRSTWPEEASR